MSANRQRVMSAPIDRQRVWRGLPQSTAARRPPKQSTPAVTPMLWDPAGDESAQDAALRAATRVKEHPPDAPPSFSTFRASTAVRPPETAATKDENTRQSEPGLILAHRLTAVRAATVCEEARKKQAAAARAARERADPAAAKATGERAQPLQLARASLATSERDRRLRDQPSRLRVPQREPPSETGRALLAALGVDENDAANAHRSQRKSSDTSHQMLRTRPSSGRLTSRSGGSGGGGGGGGGGANGPLTASGRPPRTRLQASDSLSSSCGSARTPWLGIGFDGANADPWGRAEVSADEEPPAGVAAGEELEAVCEPPDTVTDMRLQGLQAQLEHVRRLEAMLQSEKQMRGSDVNIS